jgi:hypothetical protein
VSRLSLQVVYLWRHVLSTQRRHLYIVWWSNLEILFGPPPPQVSLHRRGYALSSNSNGTRSVYCRNNPKRSLYCEMSVSSFPCLHQCIILYVFECVNISVCIDMWIYHVFVTHMHQHYICNIVLYWYCYICILTFHIFAMQPIYRDV